jgi:hypothetical protein
MNTRRATFFIIIQYLYQFVYFNEKGFKAQDVNFNPGTLIILRGENKRIDFDQTVLKIANKHAVSLTALASGFVQEGLDLGSSSVKHLP